MKVVFLVRLFSPHIGGVERHVDRISRLLSEEGHDITIITEQYDVSLPRVEKGNVLIYRIPIRRNGFWKKFTIWWWLLKNIGLLENSDVIHAHDVFFWYFPFRLLFRAKKVFITFHGYEGAYPVSRKAKLIRKISEKLAFGNICVGDFIQKWYGTTPDYVTYGGADTNHALKNRAQMTNKKLKIMFVGRLETDTGVEKYAQILRLLRDLKIDCEFRAFGKGKLENVFKPFGDVIFSENPSKQIENADIVFASSYLSILDALALGKLVVAVYGNPLKRDYLEMSPMSKYILTGDDPEKLTEEMKSEAKKQQFKQKVEEGSHWAREQTWEKVLEKYKKLWNI